MAIKIDKEKCIGCGSCASACPEVFEMETSGEFKAHIKEQKDIPCVKEAIDICPVDAITK